MSDWTVPSREAVARFCRVSVRTVKNWTAVDGFPAKTKQGYDLSEIFRWRVQHERKLHVRPAGSPDDRLKTAKAQMAELDLAQRRSEPVNTDEAARVRRRYFITARTIITGITDRLMVVLP